MNYINYKISDGFRSAYNPVVGFDEGNLQKVNQFIHNRVVDFFTLIGIDIDNTEYIEIHDVITEMEFQKTTTELAKSYFYQVLFTEIKKTKQEEIADTIKYCITFDRDLAPYAKGNFNYGIIKIANRPILFYIYLDIQDLIRVSKA